MTQVDDWIDEWGRKGKAPFAGELKHFMLIVDLQGGGAQLSSSSVGGA